MTPCLHCATPCREGADFCCVGCEVVHAALRDGGLNAFYALRGDRGVPVANVTPPRFEPVVAAFDDGTVGATVGLDGLHCAGCVWLIERMPALVDGVVDARVNLGRGRLELRWSAAEVDFAQIARWLARFGYTPFGVDERRGAAQSAAERSALTRVGLSWALAANVMLLSIALYAGLDPVDDAGLWTAARWTAMLLSAVTMSYGGRTFFQRAWTSTRAAATSSPPQTPKQGRRRSRRVSLAERLPHIGVDVPVSIGLLVGFLYSAFNTVVGSGEVWFDTVAVLVAALLTARWLHARGLRVAADATHRLAALIPTSARRVTATGEAETVTTGELQRGDLVEVRAGDVVPADGIVETGVAHLDRSQLTGEARPERAEVGTSVWAGESNVRGLLRLRVTDVGADSRVGRLAAWVLLDESQPAATVQLADRLAAWFVLAILFGAVVTATVAGLYAPDQIASRVVALLVVSCPCALGMATPLAFTVGIGRAAKRGIFVRHDQALDALPDVDVLILDKTGTLTHGVTTLAGVEVTPAGSAWSPRELLAMAAAVERHSVHPVAAAFAPYDAGLTVADYDELPSIGVRGMVDGHLVEVRAADDEGEATTVALDVDGRCTATVALGDSIRKQAREVIGRLTARGVEVYIASGDHAAAVAAVASRVGVGETHVLSRQTPQMKLELVQALKASGRRVAMIGDGVNDAAALRAADVGVAMNGGAGINAVAGDVQLGRPGLPLVDLFDVADDVKAAVRRNLSFSIAYNVLAIGAAAAGIVTPLVAAIAMPVSSILVVGSSLAQGPLERRRTRQLTPLPVPATGTT